MNLVYVKEANYLRQELLRKFNEFISICNKLTIVLNRKKYSNMTKCLEEMKDYFEDNDFKVEQRGNDLLAAYSDVIISLKYDDEYSSNQIFYQFEMQPNKIYNGIVYKVCNNDEGLFCWKNVLKIEKENVNFENYENLIGRLYEIEILDEMLLKLNENIKHYKNTIQIMEDIKFIYTFYKSEEIEYDTFKEAFEYYI
ncbi:MAG: hypothetical protein ACRDCB_08755 [Clostridium sp.]